MPTSKETIENRELDGMELRAIVEQNIKQMLDSDGMYREDMSYGRVGVEIRISLHLENSSYPKHETIRTTKTNKAEPRIVEPPIPNADPKNSTVKSSTREIQIDNPNKERLKAGLPLKGTRVSQQTGKPEEIRIQSSPEQAGMSEEEIAAMNDNVEDKDSTAEKKRNWKL